MTVDDMARLQIYRRKRGPLNPMLRSDTNAAVIATAIMSAARVTKKNGENFELSDFMPWMQEEEKEATLEDVFDLFKGLAKRGESK